MKKQFFYAAFALAMMASCTSEDNLPVDPVNPTPEEDKVAINLGIDAPSVNAEVGSRGTGSVGDVAGANNKWNSQKLFIAMIDRSTGNLAKVPGTSTNLMSWDTYTYVAPRSDDQSEASGTTPSTIGKGNIRIYNTYPATVNGATEDKGTIQYLYYPTQGTFDFYGWHTDDAQCTPSIDATNGTNITISGITIDGTQDIMGAKTKAFDDETYGDKWNSTLNDWVFSARTARAEIDPILAFEHKLARVKFFVKAGSYSAALHDKNGDEKDAIVTTDPTSTGAMYITSIKAQNMHSVFNMNLNASGITTSNPSTPIEFVLGDRGTDGTIGTLTPKAANYHKGDVPTGQTGETQVGEAMMFLPVEGSTANALELKLGLKQYLQKTDDETNQTPDEWDYEIEEATVIVKAEDLVASQGQTAAVADVFEAGKSYNVYITIYGFERIEVSAELTPWDLGGNVDVDIEEDVPGNESDDEGDDDTVTSKVLNFVAKFPQGVEDLNATITVTEKDSQTAVEEGAHGYELTINKTYVITATAEGYIGTLEYKVTGDEDELANIEVTMTATTEDEEEEEEGGESPN